MWPWGHLAVGYLLYSVWVGRQDRLPTAIEVALLAFGTLLPDLVDKPLAWTFGLLESGRSLGHSVLVAALVLMAVHALFAPRLGRAPIAAFAVGYLSHPLADFPFGPVLAGDLTALNYLLWPLVSVPPPETDISLLAYILAFEPGPYDWFQFALVGLAVVRWQTDGRPGWETVVSRVRSGRVARARR